VSISYSSIILGDPLAKQTHSMRRLRNLAEYDLFPTFSAKARIILYNPLGVLVLAAIAALLCGFFLHSQGFILCGCMLAVIGLGVFWPTISLWGISAAVSFERSRSSEGESVEIQLTLCNRLLLSARGLAVRNGFGEECSQPVASVSAAPGRSTAICRWNFIPNRRGVYPLNAPQLTSGFPFGIWEYSRRLNVQGSLIVWPKTYSVGPIPPVRGDRQVEGNVSRSKVGSTGDVLGVRPYRRGDSPRRIHWGQSAKHDRLIVCELQSNARPVIQIVLDADPRIHAGAGENGSREWAIRIVASLAKGWLEQGAQVGLAWAGFDIPPSSGIKQTHKILDALAALPGSIDKPLADVLDCPKCRGFRDGLQVIVTTDRSRIPGRCDSCATDDRRWVILASSGFTAGNDINSSSIHALHSKPWLLIDAVEEIPAQLRNGWREARHGT
jgi:uncharacterized protein (DUF58 family)